MLTYFEKYYIGKKNPKNHLERKLPSYPISTWNVYNKVLNGDKRTNNNLEAWHAAFEVIIIIIFICFNFFLILLFKQPGCNRWCTS